MQSPQKIGFVINKLEASDKTIAIIKYIEKRRYDNSYYIFYNDPAELNIANSGYFIIHAKDSYTFDGTLYGTCEYTARQVANNFRSKNRSHLIFELEWCIDKTKKFDDRFLSYLSPNLNLSTVSQDYKEVIENVWHRKVDVINGFFQ